MIIAYDYKRFYSGTFGKLLCIASKGPFYILRKVWQSVAQFGEYFKPNKFFCIDGKYYQYFHHLHNNTAINERAIEIPFFVDLVNQYAGKRILEVGNVLDYYIPSHSWPVVDKYDTKDDLIINQDIEYFTCKGKFDLVVSISTMEHLNTFEDALKAARAIEHIKENLLAKGGQFWFSIPIGWDTILDAMIELDGFDMSRVIKMIRMGSNWHQINSKTMDKDFFSIPYDTTRAKAVVFVCIQG